MEMRQEICSHDGKIRNSVTLSVIKRQMISDGAIRIGEMHFAGPVPDEGDYPTELEGKWGVDGIWIDPEAVDCRTERRNGVHDENGSVRSCR